MNPTQIRNQAIRTARIFFAERGILEVMTPKGVPSPALEPYIDAVGIRTAEKDTKLYLATSPEFALKKIFAAEVAAQPQARGIYEIAPVFRDDRPGKNHALEFIMVEWYLKSSSLREILTGAAELISLLSEKTGALPVNPAVEILDLQSLFHGAGHGIDFTDETDVLRKYQSLHGALPQHLNNTDAAIVCFNLLFDEIILPLIRGRKNLVAVSGYPEYLGALAYAEDGVAQRAEIYFNGLEVANGYREEFRRQIVESRWRRYNEIRLLRGVETHPIDQELLAILAGMEGVAGIALGLERLLVCLHPGHGVQEFLQAGPSSSFLP